MSILTGFDLCRAAMAAPDVTAPERSVLMVLAIMANDAAQCWPPINGETGLTTKTVLSERAVQRAIQRLVQLGHIQRKQLRNGVVYTVHPASPATETGVSETGDTETPAAEAPRPATQAPKLPKTTITPKVKRAEASEPTRVPSDFEPNVKPQSITGKVMADWPPGAIAEQVEHFVDRHTAQGTLSLDWQASWRTWVKNWKKFNANRNGHRPRHDRSEPQNAMVRAVRRAEAREAGGDGAELQPRLHP